MPDYCPEDIAPNEKYRLYADLVAPPADCEPCDCAPSVGTCASPPAGLPESIKILAGACGQEGVETLPFDGPVGWDGSCTSENALPAGEKCPAGELDAVRAVRLGLAASGPASESCAPTTAIPKATVETRWEVAALACHAAMSPYQCGLDEYCVSDPGLEWDQCVVRKGVHETCPSNYSYYRRVMFPEKPIDTRGCSACECGTPEGSGCLGTLRLYDDAACSNQFTEQNVASFGDQCGNIYPPGRAIAAKAITDISYVAGSCAATGGEPTGEAKPDADPMQAVTFCCVGPFYELK